MRLGAELERAGRKDEAIAHYESVLNDHPEMGPVANRLAGLLLDNRKDSASFVLALNLARRFEEATQPALLDTLGWA
jgi:predicted TPR repeat methyltransferase